MKNLIIIMGTIILGAIIVSTLVLGDTNSLKSASQEIVNAGNAAIMRNLPFGEGA